MIDPIEVWVRKNSYVEKLLADFSKHADNAADWNLEEFNNVEFERNCAISLRLFLEENK